MELKIGHIYILKGMGEMKLFKLPESEGLAVVFKTALGHNYYADEEQIYKEATLEDIEARKRSLEAHGMHKEAKLLQKMWTGREDK
jgi:hypothetical protein